MGSAIVPDECFKTNPPELPVDRLRSGMLSHVEAVRLGAASARADSFTYGEPFRMFAVALDLAADYLAELEDERKLGPQPHRCLSPECSTITYGSGYSACPGCGRPPDERTERDA